jgi:hypothetical protein
MSKYAILKELINEWIERERENMEHALPFGVDCAGYSLAAGAFEAYCQVLSDIAELESEVSYE